MGEVCTGYVSNVLVSHKEREKRATRTASVTTVRNFSKKHNLQCFLKCVAKKCFDGEPDEVKEYSVADQALSRPESFDPHSGTIVHVTTHALRKRLKLYYTHEGATHAVQIQCERYANRSCIVTGDRKTASRDQATKPTGMRFQRLLIVKK